MLFENVAKYGRLVCRHLIIWCFMKKRKYCYPLCTNEAKFWPRHESGLWWYFGDAEDDSTPINNANDVIASMK